MPSKLCDKNIVIEFPEEYFVYVRRIIGDLFNEQNYRDIRYRVYSTWKHGGYVATVGDRVTHDLLDLGIVPDIAIIDRKEKRGSAPTIGIELFNGYDLVINKKSTINMGLCSLIKRRLVNKPWLFVVEGEEDLVGFPVVLALPIGSAFIYGAPNVGAVYVDITEDIKREAKSILMRILGSR